MLSRYPASDLKCYMPVDGPSTINIRNQKEQALDSSEECLESTADLPNLGNTIVSASFCVHIRATDGLRISGN